MFNNLIESSSHRQELKRRGSFFLLTTLTYALMVVLGGIASIYAYDARLAEQNYEQVITMLPPEPAPEPQPANTPTQPDKPRSDNNRSTIPERAIAMLGTNRPDKPPEGVSAEPNKVLPLPPGPVSITGRDYNPPVAAYSGSPTGSGGTRIVPPTQILEDEPPEAPPVKPPVLKVIKSPGVINSQAISLPRPTYPPLAKQIGLQGVVNIQVLIDEGGKVISAQVISGHTMLVREARLAALQARFSPTLIGDQPVKVSGVITYNFVLNR